MSLDVYHRLAKSHNRLADLQSSLRLAIAMRDPDMIQECRDNIQDYKEEMEGNYAADSQHRTDSTGNTGVGKQEVSYEQCN